MVYKPDNLKLEQGIEPKDPLIGGTVGDQLSFEMPASGQYNKCLKNIPCNFIFQ